MWWWLERKPKERMHCKPIAAILLYQHVGSARSSLSLRLLSFAIINITIEADGPLRWLMVTVEKKANAIMLSMKMGGLHCTILVIVEVKVPYRLRSCSWQVGQVGHMNNKVLKSGSRTALHVFARALDWCKYTVNSLNKSQRSRRLRKDSFVHRMLFPMKGWHHQTALDRDQ